MKYFLLFLFFHKYTDFFLLPKRNTIFCKHARDCPYPKVCCDFKIVKFCCTDDQKTYPYLKPIPIRIKKKSLSYRKKHLLK